VPLQARQVDSSLTSKGFHKVDNDHHFYFLYHNGKKTSIRTKISHGEREISDTNCGLMARQMKLTTPQFKQFVDCKLVHAAYVELLINAGHLERPEGNKPEPRKASS
jgi:hypothetical protein